MRILGIDPGYGIIGFGLLDADRGRFQLLRCGAITTPAGMDFSARLEIIYEDMKELLEKTKDTEMTEDQVAEMKAAQEKLMASAQALFTKVYEQAQAAGAAGAGPDMGGAQADAGAADDVVDGDYREV